MVDRKEVRGEREREKGKVRLGRKMERGRS